MEMETKPTVKGNLLGRGRHGRVYSAFSFNHTPHHLAVKSAFSSHSSLLAKEKRILSELQHCPEIVHCYGDDSTMEEGVETYNLFLEYAPGGSLSDLIRNSGGTLPESNVQLYTRMILKGLCHIHEKGYVHCDIKPSNILIFPLEDGGNKVKIADFGLAKRVGEESSAAASVQRDAGLHVAGVDAYWETGLEEVRKGGPAVQYSFGEPEIPESVSEEGKDFLRMCFRRRLKRWTARMLLNHPFITEEPSSMAMETSHFDWNQLKLQDPLASTGSSSSPRSRSNSFFNRFCSSMQSLFKISLVLFHTYLG
ncbi:hypothetical protein AAG906_017680 [Vitis piasezkii]